MSSSFDTESHKSPEDLEREIDAKRASISNIVDSLESRFTPGQLFDQALSYTKGNGGEFFQNLGTTLKDNPVPTVLTGIGLAWLAMNQNKPYSVGTSTTGSGLGKTLSNAVDQVSGAFAGVGDRLHGASDSARDTTQQLKDKTQQLKDKASDVSHRASDSLGASADQLRRSAHDASDKLHDQTAQLKGQFDQVLKDQPLVLAAIGIAVGAALGAALPATRKEDQWMGKARDDVTAKLKAKGNEAYAVAKDSFKQTADASDKPEQPGKSQTDKPASGTDLSAGLGTVS